MQRIVRTCGQTVVAAHAAAGVHGLRFEVDAACLAGLFAPSTFPACVAVEADTEGSNLREEPKQGADRAERVAVETAMPCAEPARHDQHG